MLKDTVFPTLTEEFYNAAEILRELSAQLHFNETRNHFMTLASMLEQQAQLREQAPDMKPTDGGDTASHPLFWGS